jgi:hypothetical protein
MYKVEDFDEWEGMYYVGGIVDVDGDGWVDREQLELIILELNNFVY